MKKAPRRFKKALGGDVNGNPVNDQDDPRKKAISDSTKIADAKALAAQTGVRQLNPTYPTQDEQMYQKGMISKSELARRKSDAFQNKGSGTGVTGRPTYGLQDPRVLKAKGGEVKKMTKAPFRFKKK